MKELIKELLKFRDDRDWGKYHTLPELARAIMVEGAELNRFFLWGPEWQGELDNEKIELELADKLIYIIYALEKIGSDPETAIRKKIPLNAIKYPIKG